MSIPTAKTWLDYFVNLLKKKEPDENYADFVKDKRKLHESRMLENINDNFDVMPYKNFIKAFEKTL